MSKKKPEDEREHDYPDERLAIQESQEVTVRPLELPQYELQPDPDAIEIMLSQNPATDKKLKKAAELCLLFYSKAGETKDASIAKAIHMRLRDWQRWRKTPEFRGYYEGLIKQLFRTAGNRSVAIIGLITEILLAKALLLKEEFEKDPDSVKLDKLLGIIRDLKKTDPAIFIQQANISADTNIVKVEKQEVIMGPVQSQIKALEAHLRDMKEHQGEIVEAEIEEVD